MRALSSAHQGRVEFEALYVGVDFSETLTMAPYDGEFLQRLGAHPWYQPRRGRCL